MSNIFWPGATSATPGQPAILYWVPNLAFLRTVDSTVYDYINIEGFATPGDGGDGRYFPVPSDTTNGCVFTGTIAGTVLTITGVTNGSVATGYVVTGTAVTPGTKIVSGGTGTGGVGTYNLSTASAIASPAAMTADNNDTIIVGLNGVRWYYSPIAFPAISGFQFSGADGTGRNVLTVTANTNLAITQSGTTVFTTGAVAVNPPAMLLGLNYVIYGNTTGAVTVTPVSGQIEFPDGSTAASYTLPLNSDDAIVMVCDGTVWRAETIGRLVVANGVNANEAASIFQLTSEGGIRNGMLRVDQRNAGAAQTLVASTQAYTVDRFYALATGANITGQQVSAELGGYKLTGAAGCTATLFGTRLDSWLTSKYVNQQLTCQIVASSSTITTLTWTAYSANAVDNFAAKTVIATGTLTINSVATKYTFGFNAGANAANGIAIEFSTTGIVAAQTINYANIQLDQGSAAKAFRIIDIDYDQFLCARYFLKIAFNQSWGAAGAGLTTNWAVKFANTMRAVPTAVILTSTTFTNVSTNGAFSLDQNFGYIQTTCVTTGQTLFIGTASWSSEL